MKKNFLEIVCLALFSFTGIFPVKAFTGAGSGVQGDAYIISTPEQLAEIALAPSAYYELEDDIDLTSWITTNSPVEGWNPIATFTGNFDGKNHVISGLWINRSATNSIGLFGTVAGGAVIKNAGVKVADSKSVIGNENVGIMVGYATNSPSGNVSITDCFAIGNVTGTKNVGAILGYNNWINPTIENCYAAGKVISSGDGAGGLVGSTWGSVYLYIRNSYAINSVQAGNTGASGGGILGGASANAASGINIEISNCVAANPTVDGGTAQRILAYAKSGANITYISNYAFEGTLVKGLPATGTLTNNNGLNKTAAELMSEATYSGIGWDFDNIWQMSDECYSLPVLKGLPLSEQPAEFLLDHDVNVSTISDSNGSISTHTGVKAGDNVIITVTPNVNYAVATFIVNGEDKKSELVGNQYSLDCVKENFTIEVTFSLSTSLKNVEVALNVSVTNGELIIESGKQIGDVKIIDLSGRTLLTSKLQLSTASINISALSAGVYLLKIGNETVKFVK